MRKSNVPNSKKENMNPKHNKSKEEKMTSPDEYFE
jgi:hypothetical protein